MSSRRWDGMIRARARAGRSISSAAGKKRNGLEIRGVVCVDRLYSGLRVGAKKKISNVLTYCCYCRAAECGEVEPAEFFGGAADFDCGSDGGGDARSDHDAGGVQ